ncbi:MAG: winged helix-turn-helix domain-containing protein [Clostridiales bacterium]|nr:winged helix-turn-helix domain-containing protein [Clostridiales bacterium]
MKKRVGFVSLDAATVSWLSEKLKTAPAAATGAQELLEALSDLACGGSQTLMLELGDAGTVSSASEIVCGELHISPAARCVRMGQREISLTPKEFDILLFLARNRGEVFTKEQIYQAVWDGEYVMDDSNIMAFIRKLRKKIEPHPDAPEYILTIWGIGYKFNDNI